MFNTLHKSFQSLAFVTLSLALAGCGEDSLQKVENQVAEPGLQVGILVSSDGIASDRYFVTLPDGSTTATDALLATGAEIAAADFGFGTAICSISGVGQPVENCFGDPDLKFWAFFTESGESGWVASDVGTDQFTVTDGGRIAFVWTAADENFDPVLTPPAASLVEIVDP